MIDVRYAYILEIVPSGTASQERQQASADGPNKACTGEAAGILIWWGWGYSNQLVNFVPLSSIYEALH